MSKYLDETGLGYFLTKLDSKYVGLSNTQTITGSKTFANTGAPVLTVKRTNASYGAFIDYKNKNQDVKFWRIGMENDDTFNFFYSSNSGSSFTTPLKVSTSGNIILNNNIALQWKNSSATAVDILKLDNANNVQISSPNHILATNSTFKPYDSADATYDLGKYASSSDKARWRNLYLSGTIRNDNANYGLSLPAMTSWTANKTIATTDQIPSLTNYVTLDGAQTITGAKTFSAGTEFTGSGEIGAGSKTTVYADGLTNVQSNTTYTYLFPAKNGTFALTSDIPTDTNYYPIRSYTSGLQISSYSGSVNCQLYVPNANDSSQAGVVSTSDQTFYGKKTFKAASETPMVLQSNTTGCWLDYKNSSGTLLGSYGVNSSKKPKFYDGTNTYTLAFEGGGGTQLYKHTIEINYGMYIVTIISPQSSAFYWDSAYEGMVMQVPAIFCSIYSDDYCYSFPAEFIDGTDDHSSGYLYVKKVLYFYSDGSSDSVAFRSYDTDTVTAL